MSPQPAPFVVHGPPGTAEVVDAMLAMLAPDVRYRLAHHDDLTGPPAVEVHEHGDGDRFAVGAVDVVARATDHRPVEPTLGYRFEHDREVAALAGDTVPCDGLDALCAGADVYVQTVVRDPARLAAQAAHREPALADTYTLVVRPTIDRLDGAG
jgi:ribonuclease Z